MHTRILMKVHTPSTCQVPPASFIFHNTAFSRRLVGLKKKTPASGGDPGGAGSEEVLHSSRLQHYPGWKACVGSLAWERKGRVEALQSWLVSPPSYALSLQLWGLSPILHKLGGLSGPVTPACLGGHGPPETLGNFWDESDWVHF